MSSFLSAMSGGVIRLSLDNNQRLKKTYSKRKNLPAINSNLMSRQQATDYRNILESFPPPRKNYFKMKKNTDL